MGYWLIKIENIFKIASKYAKREIGGEIAWFIMIASMIVDFLIILQKLFVRCLQWCRLGLLTNKLLQVKFVTGQYLNTPADKHIEFGLLMNGKKQLTAELGVLREEAKNGFIFSPRLYLAYNSTDVAKLIGINKIIDICTRSVRNLFVYKYFHSHFCRHLTKRGEERNSSMARKFKNKCNLSKHQHHRLCQENGFLTVC